MLWALPSVTFRAWTVDWRLVLRLAPPVLCLPCHRRRLQESRIEDQGVNALCVSTKSDARVEDVPRADIFRIVISLFFARIGRVIPEKTKKKTNEKNENKPSKSSGQCRRSPRRGL